MRTLPVDLKEYKFTEHLAVGEKKNKYQVGGFFFFFLVANSTAKQGFNNDEKLLINLFSLEGRRNLFP